METGNKKVVDGKTVNEEEFKKIREDLSKDKSKLLKEVSSGNFKTLTKMNG